MPNKIKHLFKYTLPSILPICKTYISVKKNKSLFFNFLFDFDLYAKQLNNVDKVNYSRYYYYNHYNKKGYLENLNPHPLFDTEYYLNKYPEALKSGLSPIEHFEKIGGPALYNPHPGFNSKEYKALYLPEKDNTIIPLIHFCTKGWKLNCNPNSSFNISTYLKLNPDVRNANINPFIHYILYGHNEGRKTKEDYYSSPDYIEDDNKAVTHLNSPNNKTTLNTEAFNYNKENIINDLLKKASEIEPQIAIDYFSKGIVSDIYNVPRTLFAKIFKEVILSIKTKPDYIFLLPQLKKGGADWVACVHINFLLEKKYKVLIINTQGNEDDAKSWIKGEAQFISLSKYLTRLDSHEYLLLLQTLCVQLKPKVIHNINSFHGWEMFKVLGKQLSSQSKLCAVAFCHDYNSNKISVGYLVKYLKQQYEMLDIVFTDNLEVLHNLKTEFGLTKAALSKFSCIYYPSRDLKNKNGFYLKRDLSEFIKNSSSYKFLWAGRICDQKRPDLLFNIAMSNPNIEFVVYGYLYQSNAYYKKLIKCSNISFKGSYESFDEILDMSYIGLLYTSSWDGLPNVLIEACTAGMPVIASSVGGIKELINENTGYLIKDIESIKDYSNAIKDIISNPEKASTLAKNAYDLISTRHSNENLEQALIKSGYLV